MIVKAVCNYVYCISGQLHIFAANTEHPTINDYSEEIEFASVVGRNFWILCHWTSRSKFLIVDVSDLLFSITQKLYFVPFGIL